MLKPGTFLVRDIESLDIQVDNTLVKSDIEHRGLVHEEAFADDPVDHLPFEPDPVLFPTGIGERPVCMPYAGEKKKHLSFGNQLRLARIAVRKNTLAVGDIQQLVFAQHPAFVHIEKIALRMARRRVILFRGDRLATHAGHDEPPELVLFGRDQVPGFVVDVGKTHGAAVRSAVCTADRYAYAKIRFFPVR